MTKELEIVNPDVLTFSEGPSFGPEAWKTGLVFDGRKSAVYLSEWNPPAESGNAAFTIEAWIQTIRYRRQIIFSFHGGKCTLYTDGYGRLIFEADFILGPQTSGLNHGAWDHVAVTFDGSTCQLYINGVRSGVAAQMNIVPGVGEAWIGSTAQANSTEQVESLHFEGAIAEVRVWNRALQPAEIAAYRATRPTGNEPELVGWWPLDSNAPGLDRSSRNHHGRIDFPMLSAAPERRVIRRGTGIDFGREQPALRLFQHDLLVGEGACAFTLEAWIKTARNGRRQQILTFGRETETGQCAYWYVDTDGKLAFDLSGWTGPRSDTFVGDDVWHHVAVTCDGTSLLLYMDGVATRAAMQGPLDLRRGEGWIGAATKCWDIEGIHQWRFQGKIAEVRVWSRRLDASELTTYTLISLTGKELGLVGLWRLDAATNDPYEDLSSHARHALAEQAAPAMANFGVQGLLCNGTSTDVTFDRARIPNTGPFTLAMTFLPHAADGERTLVSQNGTNGAVWYLGRDAWGRVRVGNDWEITGAMFPADDRWHTLVLVRGNEETILYVDGVERARLPGPIVCPNGSEFRIGRRYGNNDDFFCGVIAEVAVYRAALDAAQVAAYMPGALIGAESELHALVRFDMPNRVFDRVTGAFACVSNGAWWRPLPSEATWAAVHATYLDPASADPNAFVEWACACLVFGNDLQGLEVSLGDALQPQRVEAFTIETWIQIDENTAQITIVHAGSDQLSCVFYVDSLGRLQFTMEGGQLQSTAVVNDGAWHHVAAVVAPGLSKLYIDGSQAAEANFPPFSLALPFVRIGTELSNPELHGFVGAMAALCCWSKALTAREIAARMVLRPRGDEEKLIACWFLDRLENPCDMRAVNGTGGNILGVSRELRARPSAVRVLQCMPGRGYAFDGKTAVKLFDYGRLIDPDRPSFTIEALIRTSSGGRTMQILSFGAENDTGQSGWFFLHPDGKLGFDLCGWSGPTSHVPVNDDVWHHVAITCNWGTFQLYLDGKPTGTAMVGPTNLQPGEAWIAAATKRWDVPEHQQWRYEGDLAEVRVWSRPFAAGEILALITTSFRNDELDLLGWWPLEDKAAPATDRSRRSRHGQMVLPPPPPPDPALAGPTTWRTGLEFDGQKHTIHLFDWDFLTGSDNVAFTLEAWIKTTASGQRRVVVSFDSGSSKSLYVDDNGFLVFDPYISAGRCSSTSQVNDGKWHHVALTCNGGSCQLYLDGVSNGAPLLGEGMALWRGRASIGDHFEGAIAEVRSWNRVLQPAEIVAYRETRPTGGEPELAGWWPLDSNAPGLDRSTRNRHGRIDFPMLSAAPERNVIRRGTGIDFGPERPALRLFQDDLLVGEGACAFTLEAWVKTARKGRRQQIVAFGPENEKGPCAHWYIDADGKLAFDLWDGSGPRSDTFVADDVWHHVAVTSDGTSLQLHVDGIASGPAMQGPLDLRYGEGWIGAATKCWAIEGIDQWRFHGKIAEVRVWFRRLDASELTTYTLLSLTGQELGLVGRWRLDAAATNPYEDTSPRARHASAELPAARASASFGVRGLLCNSTSTYATFDRALIPHAGAFTIVITFITRASESQGTLVSHNGSDGAALYLGRSTSGYVCAGDDWENTGVMFPEDARWHTLVLARGTEETILYLDGVERARLSRAIVCPNGSECSIGRRAGDKPELYNGVIAEVAVYPMALDAAQVAAYMPGALTGAESELHALVRLDITGRVFDRVSGAQARVSNGTWWRPLPSEATWAAVHARYLDRASADPSAHIDLARAGLVFGNGMQGIEVSQNDGPLHVEVAQAFTIETWIQTDASGPHNTILSWWSAHLSGRFYVDARGCLNVAMNIGYLESNPVLNDGAWHHVAAVIVSNGLSRLYIDGRTVAEKNIPQFWLNLAGGRIGTELDAPVYSGFAGAMADVRWWSSALTAREIVAHMVTPCRGDEANLLGWWPLTDVENPGLDRSVHAWHGRVLAPLRELMARPSVLSAMRRMSWRGRAFDGTTSIKLLQDGLLIAEGRPSFTVEALIRTSAAGRTMQILCFGSENEVGQSGWFFIHPDGKLGFDLRGWGGPTSDVKVNDGVWHHVVLTCADGTFQLYLDGKPTGTAKVGPIDLKSGEAWIAAGTKKWDIPQVRQWRYEGEIAEVRIWARDMAANEVFGLLTAALRGDEPDLLGWWPLDDAAALGTDRSQRARHGELVLPPPPPPPMAPPPRVPPPSVEVWRGGVVFDGTTHALRLFDDGLLVGSGACAFTLEAWIKTTASGRRMQILSFGSEADTGQSAWFFLNPEGKLAFDLRSWGGPVSTAKVNDGAWHHVAITCDGSTFQLYVDGEPTGTAMRGPIDLRSGEAWIGAATKRLDTPWDRQWRFEGVIAEVRAWTRALAQTEINTQSRSRPTGAEADLVGWWPLDAAHLDVDRSSRGRNAEISSPMQAADPARRSPAFWGTGVIFDGSKHALLVLNDGLLVGSGAAKFTLEAWIKTTASGRRMQILSFGREPGLGQGVWFFVNPEGKLQFDFSGWGGPVSVEHVNDGAWHHVAATCDAGTIQLFIDGKPSSAPAFQHIDLQSGEAWIGAATKKWDTDEHHQWRFDGALAEVRVWSQVMSASAIDFWRMARPTGKETALAGYWPLAGEAPGVDRSPAQRNAALSAPMPEVEAQDTGPAVWGTGLTFDGRTHAISLFDHDELVGTGVCSFTVEAWIRTNAGQRRMQIVSFGSEAATGQSGWFYLNPDGKLAFDFGGWGGPISPMQVNDGAWHHVAVTCNGGFIQLYLDGEPIGPASPGPVDLRAGQAWIGAATRQWDVPAHRQWRFEGDIAEVRAWTRALSATEIVQWRGTRPTGKETDLHGYWPLDGANPEVDRSSRKRKANLAAPMSSAEPGRRGPPIWRAGLIFDGQTHALRINDGVLIATGACSFSLEAWVRTNVRGRRMQILTFGNEADSGQSVWFYVNGEGKLAFDIGGVKGFVSAAAIHDGGWHHVAVTCAAGAVQLYIDGKPNGTAGTGALDLRAGEAWIGAATQKWNIDDHRQWRFSGAMAEVRAWNRTLSAEEIATSMSTRATGKETDLAGYWPLDSATNPGRDRSSRRRAATPQAAMTAAYPSVTRLSTLPAIPLKSVADVVAAIPPHRLVQQFAGGVQLVPGFTFPVRILLTPAEGVVNPYAPPGAKPDAEQDAALLPGTPPPGDLKMWSDIVALELDSDPIELTVAHLAEFLGNDEPDSLTKAELTTATPVELENGFLMINSAARDLIELDLDFVVRSSWDIGADWLGAGILVLRDPRLLVEIEAPLHLRRDASLTLGDQINFGSGAVQIGVQLPEVSVFAKMVAGTRIYVREVVSLFTVDEMPPALYNMALSDLELTFSPSDRAGSFLMRMSDVWRMQLGTKEIAVRDLFVNITKAELDPPTAHIGGIFQLADVPLILQAVSMPGKGWTFIGSLAEEIEVGDQTVVQHLYLDKLLEEMLEGAGLPIDLPRIELTTLSLSITPKTGAMKLTAAASADLSLGTTEITLHEVKLEIEKPGTNQGLVARLGLIMSGTIEDALQLERFELDFSYTPSTREWSVNGVVRATVLDTYTFALTTSMYWEEDAKGLRLRADTAPEITLPFIGLPNTQAKIGLRHLDIAKHTKEGWKLQAALGLKLVNLPDPVSRIIPDDIEFRGQFEKGSLKIGLSRVIAPQRFKVPDIDLGVGKLQLGEMLIDIRDLSFTVGATVGFEGTIAIGLPSRINHVFGTLPGDKPRLSVFRAYDPTRQEASLTILKMGLDPTTGLFVKMINPPFEGVVVMGEGWNIDLGECGAVSLRVPELRSNGAGFSASGEVSIDPTRGLWLPLTPLRDLFRQAQLTDLANALPARVRLDEIKLFQNGQFDLASLIGLRQDQLPPEVRVIVDSIADLSGKLPDKLKEFFNFKLIKLGFSFSFDAAGNLRFDLQTDPHAPLRLLLPGFPVITAVEVRRFSFGPLLGGSLFRMDVDADMHSFDFLTILLSIVLPDSVMGKDLPARNRLQRTFHVHDLLMVIFYQTGIPIPLPVFYTKLGFTYVGIEGLETSLQLYFSAPKTGPDGLPQFNIGEALKLLAAIRRYFTEPNYLLSQNPAPQQMNLVFRADAAYLQLPSYLGAQVLGKKSSTEIANVYAITAGVLDTIKTGSIRYALQATPIQQRIGQIDLNLFGILTVNVGWVLATPKECEENASVVERILTSNCDQPLPMTRVRALMPSGSALALSSAPSAPADPDGLVAILRGGIDIGNTIKLDGLFLLKASGLSGFVTAIQLTGRIGNLFAADLRGVLKISKDAPDGFLLAGSSSLTFLGRRVLYGEFAVSNRQFLVAGELDLLPPEAPIAIRGRLRGLLDGNQFYLSGAAEMTVLCIPMLAGSIEIASGKWDGVQVNRFRVSATLLGATLTLTATESQGRFLAEGTCSPIKLGSVLQIVRGPSAPDMGPLVRLSHGPNDSSFELEGMVNLLGITVATKILADRESMRFDLYVNFVNFVTAAFHCSLDPVRGFAARATFEIGVHETRQESVPCGPNGETRLETATLNTGVRVGLWMKALRDSTPAALGERVLPHEKVGARCVSLFATLGTLRRLSSQSSLAPTTRNEIVAFTNELNALREVLTDTRDVHYGLTLGAGSSRLSITWFGDYVQLVRDVISKSAALVVRLDTLETAHAAERPLWAQLRNDLVALRQAAERGRTAAEKVQAEENAFDACVRSTLDQAILMGERAAVTTPWPMVVESSARAVLNALYARALYPEDPWRKAIDTQVDVDHCGMYCDGATRKHAARVAEALRRFVAGPKESARDLANQVVAEIALRPLDAWRLPFGGLATPAAVQQNTEMLAAPVAPVGPTPITFSMGMNLEFVFSGQTHRVGDLTIEAPPTNMAEQIPGLIIGEAFKKVLGIRDDLQWLRLRIREHAKRRNERQQGLAEHVRMLRVYHGLSYDVVKRMLLDAGYESTEVSQAIAGI